MKASVQYLGHIIDADGLHATDSKIQAITEAWAPRNVQELRSFLGLLNYYARFIHHFYTPLTNFCSVMSDGSGPKSVKQLSRKPNQR